MMKYKGYHARVEFDDEAEIFHGEVIDTRDVITFQGTSVDELQEAFHGSVDDYLEFCNERGEQPEKPASGRFVVRINPSLHRRLITLAGSAGKSLNAYVAEQLEGSVTRVKTSKGKVAQRRAARKVAKQTNKGR